jgi:UPF0755 protein
MFTSILNKYVILPAAIAASVAGYIYYAFNAPLVIPKENPSFEVIRGDNISTIAKQLHTSGVLQHPDVLILITYLSGKSGTIKAGEYLLDESMTAKTLLKKLTTGDVVKRQIMFLEGWTFDQMLQELKRHESYIKITLANESPKGIMQKLGFPNQYPEGRFFPDSYRYEKNMTDLTLLRKAHEKMDSVLQSEWQQRDNNVPYKTPDEALIMASIVEKETGVADERARIAAVFINRLKLGMPLQTDPAVIYGVGTAYQGNLTKAHLLKDTPYNTYTRAGLPPTPIANPSKEAIHAALHPADEKALYFVGKGDGTHYFSQTLEEHNRAVRQYQLDRKSDNYHSRSKVNEGVKP